MKKSILIALLALSLCSLAAYSPTPVQKSKAEQDLATALDGAKDNAEKLTIAQKFLNENPEDIPTGIAAQNALMKLLDDAPAYFKTRAEGSESIARRYLHARASGDSTISIQQAEWILAKEPKNYWGLMLKATTLWTDDAEILKQVESLFQEAVKVDPSRPDAYLNLGWLYSDTEKWPEARDAFIAAMVSDPSDRLAKENLLTVYASLRDGENYLKLAAATMPAQAIDFSGLKLANREAALTNAEFQGHFTVVEYWAYT